jgi:AcrR family transcriptional regulator
VQAIHEATIQVLLACGKENLTTTKVAARAGVSVGTLYQYFPNKSALLQAVLKDHLYSVAAAVEAVCLEKRECSLAEMGTSLVTTFLAAKFKDVDAGMALYAVSDDVGGSAIMREQREKWIRAIAAMLDTAPEKMSVETRLVAATLLASMSGMSRSILDSGVKKQREVMQRELVALVSSYLATCQTNRG